MTRRCRIGRQRKYAIADRLRRLIERDQIAKTQLVTFDIAVAGERIARDDYCWIAEKRRPLKKAIL
jgi:hypothetical protein